MNFSIKWQRLVENSDTCDRCSSTEEELEKAVKKLEKSLPALGVDLTLKKEKLTKSEFEEQPKRSNLIMINDRPLED